MSDLRFTCLCPTYRRPEPIVANVIACFEGQTHADAELLILDDAGELAPAQGDGWRIIPVADRYPSLPSKYNVLASLAGNVDALAVWEDDDCYLPWHLEAHARALETHSWSHPSRAWSTYTGQLEQEGARGRFHASLAFRREALEAVGGWPETARQDFDQQLIGRLTRQFGPPGDPCEFAPPSYVFRWRTGSYHGQHFMGRPGWYERAANVPSQGQGIVVRPRFDAETSTFRLCGLFCNDRMPK